MNEEIDYLLFEDESMIRDYQAIQKTWFAKGNQRIIQTYGKHEGVKLVGFLNYETGEVYVEEHKTYNAEVFKIFLQNVLKKYPQGKIVMILDNAKIHHAKLLKEFLEKNPRLQLEFLPPYSPNLVIKSLIFACSSADTSAGSNEVTVAPLELSSKFQSPGSLSVAAIRSPPAIPVLGQVMLIAICTRSPPSSAHT